MTRKDKGIRELASYAFSIPPNGRPGNKSTGDWGIRKERNANRDAKTDSMVAFASFVHGTITPGCGCEECDSRRDLVMTLIYNKDLDVRKLGQAIYDGPSTSGTDWFNAKCPVCGASHSINGVFGTIMGERCYRRYACKRLNEILREMNVEPKRRAIHFNNNLYWVARNLPSIRKDHELLDEALTLADNLLTMSDYPSVR